MNEILNEPANQDRHLDPEWLGDVEHAMRHGRTCGKSVLQYPMWNPGAPGGREWISATMRRMAPTSADLHWQLITSRPTKMLSVAAIRRMETAASSLFDGDRREAMEWLLRSLPALGDLSPFVYARDVENGEAEVLALIGRIQHGVFS